MADAEIVLRWLGEGLQFEGGKPGAPIGRVDGDGKASPSPMQTMLIAIASCTASDVIEILGKMRVTLEALETRVEADRRPEPPRRYTRIKLIYETRGLAEEDHEKLRRAVALSHEKYCSALHSLRQDIPIETEFVFR